MFDIRWTLADSVGLALCLIAYAADIAIFVTKGAL